MADLKLDWTILLVPLLLPLLVSLPLLAGNLLVALLRWIHRRRSKAIGGVARGREALRVATLILGILDACSIGYVVMAFIADAGDRWWLDPIYFLLGVLAVGMLVGIMALWFNWKRFLLWYGSSLLLVCATLWAYSAGV
jgi:hypothetical protein